MLHAYILKAQHGCFTFNPSSFHTYHTDHIYHFHEIHNLDIPTTRPFAARPSAINKNCPILSSFKGWGFWIRTRAP